MNKITTPDHDAPEQIAWQGDWIVAKTRGRWEYVSRARSIRAAVILAVDDGHVLLVEQYRVPLGRRCLELPAGLVGDDHGSADEGPLAAAGRELEEETGFRAGTLEDAGEFFSSPGMVSESFTMVIASDLTKTGDGGGVEGEDIIVHRVPVEGIEQYIADRRADGLAMDVKLLLLLGSGMLSRAA
ncbi:NUDIX hydrolase [Croceicoccus mobilis]|uniref:GDP-mannose pyrophosphatase n=1 Tax=Croceicoccus mobilis TaxID=1703339 RepID=A0A917DWS9_9SPHN|nr:NUDIX hydrolase [Croceicoccus mobilis]GGD77858.1 hypothetical protein GCM10010990_29520 [Croceicoccus mobilis]